MNELVVACVTHASLVWAKMSGDQSKLDKETLSRATCEREGMRVMLQQVTIEEHQVRDLVFILPRLFIHDAEGHIDLIIIQKQGTVNPNMTSSSRGVMIRGDRTMSKYRECQRTTTEIREVTGYKLL
jgi:hypothetical protein